MARFPFPRRGNKQQQRSLTEAEQNRRALLTLVAQIAFLFMLVVTVAYALISAILGSSLFIPQDAEGVLDSVQNRSSYTWSSESIRRVKLAGREHEQHAARSATVDLARNKFQLLVAGVLPERMIYVSDGKYVISLSESDQADGLPWHKITDVCGGAPAIPAKTVAMPSAELIKAASPKLVSDKETVMGRRAWRIDFELTPQIAEQLLWIPFFEQAAPEQMEWVFNPSELERLRAGEFEVDYASAWVTRDERRLIKIDTRFTIDEGSSWRILAQLVFNEAEDPLAETDLGDPGCGPGS